MMSEKQVGAVFKFKPEDIKSYMNGKFPEDEFPWMKYGSQLASMASNLVGRQLIDRLKEVDKPCEVRVVVSVSLDFSTQPEGTVLKETNQ
jgi:hypothetical protein